MNPLLACLGKPVAIIIFIGLVVLETLLLVYVSKQLYKTSKELRQANSIIAKLKDDNNHLVLTLQKQTDAIKLLQAKGEVYKGQLAIAVKASEELKKHTNKKVKTLAAEPLSSDLEAIKHFLLAGKED